MVYTDLTKFNQTINAEQKSSINFDGNVDDLLVSMGLEEEALVAV